jgi:hypothetical protein
MKPYVFSRRAKELRGTEWQQDGEQLSYCKLALKEQEQEKVINNEVVKVGFFEGYYSLSFEYQF